MRDVVQDPGNDPTADNQHDSDEDADLRKGEQQHAAEAEPETRRQRIGSERVGVAAEHAGQRRQQDERKHHREILDDQPADRDSAALRFHQPAFLDGAEQDHGAGDRQGKPEYEAGADVHPRNSARPSPIRVATVIWTTAPGSAMARTDRRSLSEK